jgi:hypothetical protein
MKLAADNVQTLVIPACGHFVPEEAPEELLAALIPFLTAQPDGSAAAKTQPAACRASWPWPQVRAPGRERARGYLWPMPGVDPPIRVW